MATKRFRIISLQLTFCALFATLLLGCEPDNPGPPKPLTPRPPVANAGPDKSMLILTQNRSLQLDGSASFDSTGLPLRYLWRQLSGPIVTIQTPETVKSWVGELANGVYTFELEVYNINGKDFDTMQVFVQYPSYCQNNRTETPVTLTYLSELPGQHLSPEILVAGTKLVFPVYYDNQTNNLSNKIYLYDLITGNWTTIYKSLVRRAESTVVAGNKIFIAGGFDVSSRATRVVDEYDISTNTWTVHQLSEARGYVSSVVSGNKIYFAGGEGDFGTISRKIDIYDLQTNNWTTDLLPTSGRVHFSSIAVQDKVLFIGGYTRTDGFSYLDPSSIIAIRQTSGSWSLDSMILNKIHYSAIAANNKVFIAGGYLEGSPTFHVESRDMTSSEKAFSCLSQPMVAFNNPTAVVKNDRILFYNNASHVGLPRDKMEIYNWQTNTWSVGILPLNLIPEDAGTAIAIAGQQVYMLIDYRLYQLSI